MVRLRCGLRGVCRLNAEAAPAESRSAGADALAERLYRLRGLTAVPFAILAVAGATLPRGGVWAGGGLILAGEALRLWAAAHIGPHSRGLTMRAPRLVTGGPYALIRHPLYAGNGLLTAGLLVLSGAFQPWLPLLGGAAFAGQCLLFIRREERLLAAAWGPRWALWRRHTPALVPLPGGRAPFTEEGGKEPLGPWITAEGFRREWPTLRTVLGLVALMVLRSRLTIP